MASLQMAMARCVLKKLRKGHFCRGFCFLFVLVLMPLSVVFAVPAHLDKSKMKQGCRECHKGHGEKGTPLLGKTKEEICLDCHSAKAGTRTTDIYSVITKQSNHPVLQTGQFHVPGERLPEDSSSSQRHVSCYDCHNAHKAEKGKPYAGMRGYRGNGISTKRVTYEYEVCYKCHADGPNSKGGAADVSSDFNFSNVSFHPVETFGKSSFVPSLKAGYSAGSLIKCSDCHGNDDPTGPKGPHGSSYAPILKFQYNRSPGIESSNSYRLCYECHDRTSIISDHSFRAHKSHIVYQQTACAICHKAHGSRSNTALIDFDLSAVFPNSRGERTYIPGVRGTPRCLLSCHLNGQTYEHKLNQNLIYSVNGRSLPQW
jgi:predicted CXXCH cytochrome family protein